MNPTIPLASRDVVFFDTETSGLNPNEHEILDLAAIRMTPDLQGERARIERKCRMQWPERAEAKALEVNGYSEAEWKHAQPIRVALVDFAPMIDEEVVLLGHNPHFDWAFLRTAYEREGLVLPRVKYVIDTVSIVFPLVHQGVISNLSLETICSKYRVSNVGAHRAMADVMRTAMVYAKLLSLAPPRFGVPPTVQPPPAVHRDIKPTNVVVEIDPFEGLIEPEPEWAR